MKRQTTEWKVGKKLKPDFSQSKMSTRQKTHEKVLVIFIFMKMKIKTTRYHFIIIKIAKLKHKIPNSNKDGEQQVPSYVAHEI